MGKWWPTLSIIIGGVVAAVTPSVQHLLGSHPVITSVIATLIGVIAHLLPSPVSAPVTP